VTLQITDFGTIASEVCRRSRDRLAPGDAPGPNAGIRSKVIETDLIMEAPVALRVLEWQAAAYALPPRRESFVGPASRYGHLEPGDEVAWTYTPHGFDEDVGVVEGADDYGNGTVGVRLVFLDS
jgi:hypothetical protein